MSTWLSLFVEDCMYIGALVISRFPGLNLIFKFDSSDCYGGDFIVSRSSVSGIAMFAC